MEDEVREDENVHEEHEDENQHPDFGRGVDAARGVLLRFERGVEELVGVVLEEGDVGGVVLIRVRRVEGGGRRETYPEHYVGGVDGAH